MRNWIKLIFTSPKSLFIHIFLIPQPQKKVLLVIFFGLFSKMRNRAYLSTKVSKIFFVMKTREGAYLPYLSIYKFLGATAPFAPLYLKWCDQELSVHASKFFDKRFLNTIVSFFKGGIYLLLTLLWEKE